MLSDILKNTPTATLCLAGKTLQEAHDYVETHHFNIRSYGAQEGSEFCCYIGSVHNVVGEDSGEPYRTENEAAALALWALDDAASGEINKRIPGKCAEKSGFAFG